MAGSAIELKVIFNRLPSLAAEIKAQGEALVEKTADDIATGAQQRAPVRTGQLRDSIHREGGGTEATVVADAPHAKYVEYGTSRMGARPFFWPALEANRPAYLAAWRAILAGAGSGGRAGSATVTPGRATTFRRSGGTAPRYR
jgi:HK97 gp10 family phage protein